MSAQPQTPTRSAALQLRADQVETLVTHALNAPMSVVDSTLRVVYANASFARWFQRTPAEVTGLTLAALYGADALDQFHGHIDRALSGETAHYQRQICNPAGEAEWHNVSLSPWLDDEGQVLGFVSIALRVHELKITACACCIAPAAPVNGSPGLWTRCADTACPSCCPRAGTTPPWARHWAGCRVARNCRTAPN